MKNRTCLPAALPVVLAVVAAPAHASIIKQRISDINPGTELVTLVTNGNFEDASSGNNHTPAGWSRFGNMFYDFHAGVAVPANMGIHSGRIHVDAGNVGNYNQNVGLTANTDYVLSAYMWHFGDATHLGEVQLDLNDVSFEPDDGGGSISLTQSDPDANQGYFVYGTFNSGATTSVNLRAFMTYTSGSDWPNQPSGAMWDNIAITEASVFQAPESLTAVPEPTGFAVWALGGLGIAFGSRRRKR